jgi:hypothetical protein
MSLYIDKWIEYREKLYDIGWEWVLLFLESDSVDNCEDTKTFQMCNASKRTK